MKMDGLYNQGSLVQTSRNAIQKPAEQGKIFEDFYKAAIGMVNETNMLQKQAENISLDFAMGKTDNIHNVMIAQEKANIALQFTVQVRNNVLEAYREIMRMPV